MRIIGIGGTNGAGKDTLAQVLVERYGFLFVSVSDVLRDEARRRGLPVERDVLRTISAEWRREHGLGVLVDRSLDLLTESHAGIVIASIRNPGEADRIHELGGRLIWVDAPAKVRYDRVIARARTEEDAKTYGEFLAEEAAERAHSGDGATLSLEAVKACADVVIENPGTDIEAFRDAADALLSAQIPGLTRTRSDRG